MPDETKPVAYTYEERIAIKQIRESMLKKPEIIARIMDGAAHELAARVLLKAKDELSQLLEVNRAFVAAASVLAKQQKESKDENE
jgi:hypothetical protein